MKRIPYLLLLMLTFVHACGNVGATNPTPAPGSALEPELTQQPALIPSLSATATGMAIPIPCIDSLGYRLVLKEAFLPPRIRSGETMNLSIRLSNDGFAAMYNPRPLYIVLSGAGNPYEIPVPGVDPRRWAAGQEQTLTISLALPETIPPGIYQLGLWLPDASSSLRNFPAYAVRFANENVWDATTGINILSNEIRVIP